MILYVLVNYLIIFLRSELYILVFVFQILLTLKVTCQTFVICYFLNPKSI